MRFTPIFRLAGLVVCFSGLQACNNSSAPQTQVVSSSAQQFKQATQLQGMVSNDQGPVKAGLVIAYSEQGRELARSSLTDNARYTLELAANTPLPVVLHYLVDEKTPQNQHLIAVAVHSSIQKYDINPRSTQIAEQAKKLGGYSHKNMVRAAESTGIVPADNKTTAGFRGDPTTQYGGWH